MTSWATLSIACLTSDSNILAVDKPRLRSTPVAPKNNLSALKPLKTDRVIGPTSAKVPLRTSPPVISMVIPSRLPRILAMGKELVITVHFVFRAWATAKVVVPASKMMESPSETRVAAKCPILAFSRSASPKLIINKVSIGTGG